MIQIKNLHKTFHKKNRKQKEVRAVNNTSLSLDATGLVCILGASGSGKTTLMNIVSGLDDFDGGQLQIDDIQLEKYSASKFEKLRAGHLGYIFQNYLLIEENTVEENIRLALRPFEILDEEIDNRCTNIMKKLGILHLRGRSVSQLSGGQKQRVAIARVIVKEPKIIFADEPTGNLDEANTLNVLNLLKELSNNCLIIMVTHDTVAASVYADRIITIEQGCVVSDIENDGISESRYIEHSVICLDRYEKQNLKGNGLDVSLYGTPKQDIHMRIVWTGSRYYIDLLGEEAPVILLTKDSEIQLVDVMPEPDREDKIEPQEFTALQINQHKNFNEIKKLAREMFEGLSNRYMYLKFVFIAVTLIVSISACVFLSVYRSDKTTFVTADSHYVTVTLEKNQPITDSFLKEQALTLLKDLRKEGYIIVPDGRYPLLLTSRVFPEIDLIFSGKYFNQVRVRNAALTSYSIVPSDLLSEGNIIDGSIGKGPYDIVIDKWLADRIVSTTDQIFGNYRSYDDLIGCKVSASGHDTPLVITGICDTDEPSVYMDPYMLLYLEQWNVRFDYNNGELKDTLELIVNGNTDLRESFSTDYEEVLDECLSEVGRFLIYTDDPETVLSFMQTYTDSYMQKGIRTNALCTALDEMNTHEAQFQTLVMNIAISFLFVMVLSVLLFYFTMHTYLENKKRLILIHITQGIRRVQIGLAYLWSVLQIATRVVFPTGLMFAAIITIASQFKLFKHPVYYPWWAILGVFIIIFLTAFIPSLIPALRMLSKKPVDLNIVE